MTLRAKFALCWMLLAAVAARADAPPTRWSIGADTVLDLKTTLHAQRATPATTYTHALAAAYCDALTLDGASDWRLPHVKELRTLVDVRRVVSPRRTPS